MNAPDRKVAFVTGAASGIGAATATAFARTGAVVAVVDVDRARGEKVVQQAGDEGGTASLYPCDVSNPNSVEEVVAAVIDDLGHIDILFNNAGIIDSRGVADTPVDAWQRVIATNLNGVYYCCHFVLPHMLERGQGAIISTGSPHGLRGGKGIAAYSAAKGGIIALTRQMAVDYGRAGIRVNCVVPGAIDTPMLHADVQRGGSAEDNVAGWANVHPLGRVGRPEEIANAVVWLASDEASFVHGAILRVDGGLVAQLLP